MAGRPQKKFVKTGIPGMLLVEIEPAVDSRGFFVSLYSQEEFAPHGLDRPLVQAGFAHSSKRGTVRGMHYQTPSHAEGKIVLCTKGALHDVVVDVRRESPTYGDHAVAVLTAGTHTLLYVPPGCAHGYQTLADDTEAHYWMTAEYSSAHERGFRFDDPAFGVEWPLPVRSISEKDRTYPDFRLER